MYLGYSQILDIHYYDINVEFESVSDKDIENFFSEFAFGIEIIEGLLRNEIITDEQIKNIIFRGLKKIIRLRPLQ